MLGSRQAGKTTLVKDCFPHYHYVSLENPEARALAQGDPRSFLKQHPSPVIFDEIQRVPDLLSWIQEIVDENPDKKGQFILTASHQPLLRNSISQTLAGRTVLLTLMPLSIAELLEHQNTFNTYEASEWMHTGFLPEIYRSNLDPTISYRSYLQTYVERDVRQIINVKDLVSFERFLKLLAGRVGQLFNASSLASDVGVDPKTISEWVSVLEASFIVFRLVPYFENFGKRIVKSPKLYFNDIGLATYLLGLNDTKSIEQNPLYGNLFENLVVAELMKTRLNQALEPELYFYRDRHGKEVDLLWRNKGKLIPIEVKSSRTYQNYLLKNVSYFTKFVLKSPKNSGYLIYSGQTQRINGQFEAVNYNNCHSILFAKN